MLALITRRLQQIALGLWYVSWNVCFGPAVGINRGGMTTARLAAERPQKQAVFGYTSQASSALKRRHLIDEEMLICLFCLAERQGNMAVCGAWKVSFSISISLHHRSISQWRSASKSAIFKYGYDTEVAFFS